MWQERNADVPTVNWVTRTLIFLASTVLHHASISKGKRARGNVAQGEEDGGSS